MTFESNTAGAQVTPAMLEVVALDPAGRDTLAIRLARPDRQPLLPATAGAHVTLHLPGGIERQYSLLDPGEAPLAYTIAVRREAESRGGSRLIHESLAIGDRLPVAAPRNDFPLDEQAAFSVLIGGGIGVTPLLAMATRLASLGRDFQFHAAFRSRDDVLLRDRLEAAEVRLHLDDVAGEPFPLTETIAASPRDAHLYCCGPAAMVDDFVAAARAGGRDEATIHCEYFTPPAPPLAEGSFTLVLARSGIELVVPPGRSILETVREAGIPAVSSCEQGTCGACEVKVLEGVPDHFDAVLSPRDKREGKSMMICCSGALSDRLVIDL